MAESLQGVAKSEGFLSCEWEKAKLNRKSAVKP
jgi:hypothetical protein